VIVNREKNIITLENSICSRCSSRRSSAYIHTS
jgi:hypothetical protein